MMTEPLLFLVGPTGSGKSRIALAVAPALDAEVLSLEIGRPAGRERG